MPRTITRGRTRGFSISSIGINVGVLWQARASACGLLAQVYGLARGLRALWVC